MTKNLSILISCLFLTTFLFSQTPSTEKQITLKGKVVDEVTKQPLEYATIILKNTKTQKISGGITDEKGLFSVQTPAGNYSISIEFISFKPIKIAAQNLTADKNLGTFQLKDDTNSLDEVVIIAEKTTVDIRLDKKVFNIGKDLSIRGGNASDVLGNVPSVQVDVEGNVSLRGNDNVTILIDGRPSALVGINGAEALRQIPAEAIERVEVITSPSARYDAEGTAGILNIILRKNQLKGFNGSIQLDLGIPERYGSALNFNLRSKKWNFFTNTGFRYNAVPGNAFNSNIDLSQTLPNAKVEERRKFERLGRSLFTSFGTEYSINNNSSIVANIIYNIGNDDDVNTNTINRFNSSGNLNQVTSRVENESEDEKRVQYTLDYINNFDGKGKRLSASFQYSSENEDALSNISETETTQNILNDLEKVIQNQNEDNVLLQIDYVYPVGENIQYEVGYRGNYRNIYNDFYFEERLEFPNGPLVPDAGLNNAFGYKELVNATYFQYGQKFNKISLLGGLRYEYTSVEIDQFTSVSENTKNYGNLFPTVNIGIETKEGENVTIGYNRRIRRPRGRYLNPFPSRSSATNIFRGNVDLNPVFTDAFDIGFLKRWEKFTLSTSAYYNISKDNWETIIQKTDQLTENGNDAIFERYPINLSTSERIGFEFTLSYKPFKFWNINSDFNLFNVTTEGDYKNPDTDLVTNFDFKNTSYFIRLNQKISLPGKTDIQINSNYSGPSQNAQFKNKGILSMDFAASKEILKEKATINFNISDVFNSRKRQSTLFIENDTEQYSEFQWRERQISVSFIYRFNQTKIDKKKNGNQDYNNLDEFEG